MKHFFLLIALIVVGSVLILGVCPQDSVLASLSGSYVYLNSVISVNDCFVRGATQTFCFQAISYTNDWDYVFYLWQRFPSDWVVNNVYVYDTPYCTSGGTFGTFSWDYVSLNEIRLTQTRYHANPSDVCTAYYCFVVTSGNPSPGISLAKASWYWTGSQYGNPPYYPCSSDGYTPSGQPACDEATTAPAFINACPSIYLPLLRQ